jgi:hypothetical protein
MAETSSQDERRRALGIPVHADDEHDFTSRGDGWCNCGKPRPPDKQGRRRVWSAGNLGGTVVKTNLDTIERNPVNR